MIYQVGVHAAVVVVLCCAPSSGRELICDVFVHQIKSWKQNVCE
jgi:hypothetical protein